METMWNAGTGPPHSRGGYALACSDGSLSVRAYRLTQAGAEKWLRRMVSLIRLAGAMYKLAACSVSPPQKPGGSPVNIPPASVVHPGERDAAHDLQLHGGIERWLHAHICRSLVWTEQQLQEHRLSGSPVNSCC